ncbi:hypothetical protein EVAR_21085_1 [Eumeta japonica]|uniref:Uncharacterized protein n=1 Tax=Eumeta variegata TaxID=151549 RepID=A0A4C1UZZ4_EUMVA|nr:hypothetical protein EVAR_21085_1 [Eumeta japonica]
MRLQDVFMSLPPRWGGVRGHEKCSRSESQPANRPDDCTGRSEIHRPTAVLVAGAAQTDRTRAAVRRAPRDRRPVGLRRLIAVATVKVIAALSFRRVTRPAPATRGVGVVRRRRGRSLPHKGRETIGHFGHVLYVTALDFRPDRAGRHLQGIRRKLKSFE